MGSEGLGRAARWLVAVAATVVVAAAWGLPVGGVAVAAAAPLNTAPPTITGVTKDGQKLRVSAGTWNGEKPIAYAYQWTRCDGFGNECEDIASARSRMYKVTSKDVGHAIRVLVTATDATGSSSETSGPTNAIDAVAPSGRAPQKSPVCSRTGRRSRLRPARGRARHRSPTAISGRAATRRPPTAPTSLEQNVPATRS